MASDIDTGSDSVDTPTPRTPMRLPPFRTFVVRKWNADHTALVETVLEAHIVQFVEPQHVQFVDIEITTNGKLDTRLHRIIYNVEEVEDVDRLVRSRLIAH